MRLWDIDPIYYECLSAMNKLQKTTDYVSPSARIITLNVEDVICSSPLPGGNEDIGYEDWD